MTNITPLRCAAFIRPDNLDGSSLVVDAPCDHLGGAAPVTVAPGDLVGALRPLSPTPGGPSGITMDVYVAASGSPWVLTGLGCPGALLIAAHSDVPAWQRGGIVVLGENGGMLPVPGQEQMWQAIWGALEHAGAMFPGMVDQLRPTPSHSTPTENVTWDGSDRHHISADTTTQDVAIDLPDPATVVNRELSVCHRNDGGTGNTVTVRLSGPCPHQQDIVLAVGGSVRLRAISGSYDIG